MELSLVNTIWEVADQGILNVIDVRDDVRIIGARNCNAKDRMRTFTNRISSDLITESKFR